jgi:ribonuclease P protein component
MGPRSAHERRALPTVRSAREIDEIFRRGRRSVDELLTVFATDSPASEGGRGRLVFIAGRKTGGAVTRNRCKRVMRAAVQRAGGPWPGKDVLMVARASLALAPVGAVDRSLQQHLRRLGIAS